MSERIYSFHFPLWCHCFTHPCCPFFLPDPHICVCNPWRAHREAEAPFWSVLSVLLRHRPLLPNPWWWFEIFFLVKSCIFFPCRAVFAGFAHFRLRNKTEAEQAWSVLEVAWWRFSEPGEGNTMFSLTMMSPAAQHGAVYTHSIFGLFSPCACLTWLVRLYVCVCVCSIDVSTGKHNSVNYYRITSIFIAFFFFFLLRRRILEKCLNVEMSMALIYQIQL